MASQGPPAARSPGGFRSEESDAQWLYQGVSWSRVRSPGSEPSEPVEEREPAQPLSAELLPQGLRGDGIHGLVLMRLRCRGELTSAGDTGA